MKNKCTILVILLVIIVFINNYISLNISHMKVKNGEGNIKVIDFPFLDNSSESRDYLFFGKIRYSGLSGGLVNIIADDCVEYIKINDITVSLEGIDENALRDYTKGFYIDLKPYLNTGENNLEIKVKDSGGKFGLTIKKENAFSNLLTILSIVLLCILLYYFFGLFSFHKITRIILIVGLLIRLFYLGNTDYMTRSYDVDAHFDYIRYVGNNYNLPEPNKGWEFYQPPLYYITGAIVYKISPWLNLAGPKALQIFSLICFFVFLLFGILIFDNIFEKLFKKNSKDLFYLAVALLVFWPSGIINSVRISNDIIFFMLYSGSLYYLIKWYDEKKDKNLFLSCLFTVLSLMTKSNSLVLVGITGILLLYRLIKEENKKKYFFLSILICVIFIAFISINILRNYHYAGNVLDSINLSLNSTNRLLYIRNNTGSYLYLDIKTFLNEPFTNAWLDYGGRQYFWNYILKTALFGEFEYAPPFLRSLGSIISWLFLLMLSAFMTALVLFRKKDFKDAAILLISLLLLCIAIILFRIKSSQACATDFRLIFPAIISFIPIYIYTINFFKEKNLIFLTYLSYIISYLFILLSILFFIFV